MRKKDKKKLYWIFGIIVIVLAIFLFRSNSTLSIIQLTSDGKAIPPETGPLIFLGNNGTFETVKLGCSSGEQVKDTTSNGVTYYINSLNFCNSLISGNQLSLESNISSASCTLHSGSSCVRTNYVQYKVLLPAGKIAVAYTYFINQKDVHSTNVAFTMGNFSASFNEGLPNSVSNPVLVYSSDIQNYQFTLTEPTEIIFRIDTGIRSVGGAADGKMVISFTPSTPGNPGCPIAVSPSPCVNAKEVFNAKGCFTKWDTSLCTNPPVEPPVEKPNNAIIIVSIILVVLVVVFLIWLYNRRR